ncbi:translation initiation factor IF-3 [Candidatus Gromoviella agglomerans]|uniref:translation initiation factor IF-3 n=1 Tax=Candidatus Gromoviella agglomerans TaxID=2806609 RepID=UPI001E58D8D4|nr:translation initiation factor IF-3 [Candidatus Gromoviella agglomerans]UFX98287.1 Translation initiation factor IF-3 [Candidatus Gromoviella agglomerans]
MLNRHIRSGKNFQEVQNRVLNYRINEEILAESVRLIDAEGNDNGIVPLRTAMTMARDANLDLVEVSGNAPQSVCKILDFSKEEYEARKKQKKMKKNSKAIEVKEIRFTARIDDHDYEVKIKQAIKFLQQDNDKVQISVIFRGRELDYKDIAYRVVDRIKKDLSEVGKIGAEPKMERKRLYMMFSPLSVKV